VKRGLEFLSGIRAAPVAVAAGAKLEPLAAGRDSNRRRCESLPIFSREAAPWIREFTRKTFSRC
jgi:hypothetical protein